MESLQDLYLEPFLMTSLKLEVEIVCFKHLGRKEGFWRIFPILQFYYQNRPWFSQFSISQIFLYPQNSWIARTPWPVCPYIVLRTYYRIKLGHFVQLGFLLSNHRKVVGHVIIGPTYSTTPLCIGGKSDMGRSLG